MAESESNKNISYVEDGAIKRYLQEMDDYDFEHFVADLWERQGWNCTVSQASIDAGIDVTATKSTPYNQKKLIQVKRYGPNTTVGGPEIQQYASLKHQQSDADSVVVVTSNGFTKSAKERARDLNVKLVDGDSLENLVKRLDAEDLLTEYSKSKQVNSDAETSLLFQETGNKVTEERRSSNLRKGDGIFTPDSSPDWLYSLERSRQWHRLVPIGIALWFGALFLAATFEGVVNPIADLLGYGIVWPLTVGIPLAWYLDMRYVRDETEWYPTGPKYIGSSFFLGPLPMLYYYYKRYKTIGI